MTRMVIDVPDADGFLLEQAAKHVHVGPGVLLAQIVSKWAAEHRVGLRLERDVSPAEVAPEAGADPRALTVEEIKHIRFLLDQDVSQQEIARRVGVAPTTVMRQRWRYAEEERAAHAREMHAEAMRKEKGE